MAKKKEKEKQEQEKVRIDLLREAQNETVEEYISTAKHSSSQVKVKLQYMQS